jgi:hypothetical protein
MKPEKGEKCGTTASSSLGGFLQRILHLLVIKDRNVVEGGLLEQ